MKCPNCGSEVSRAYPFVSLERNVIAWGGAQLRVQPRQAELMHLLVQSAPMPVPLDRMIARVLGFDHPSSDPENLMRQHLANLRAVLAPLGWVISTSVKRGYSLQPAV
jgi:DNA-binding winged helix-turn-helix (wHTH) protein